MGIQVLIVMIMIKLTIKNMQNLWVAIKNKRNSLLLDLFRRVRASNFYNKDKGRNKIKIVI